LETARNNMPFFENIYSGTSGTSRIWSLIHCQWVSNQKCHVPVPMIHNPQFDRQIDKKTAMMSTSLQIESTLRSWRWTTWIQTLTSPMLCLHIKQAFKMECLVRTVQYHASVAITPHQLRWNDNSCLIQWICLFALRGAYIQLQGRGQDVPTYIVQWSPTGNWGLVKKEEQINYERHRQFEGHRVGPSRHGTHFQTLFDQGTVPHCC
jgi:hypothetical protein